MMLDKVEQHSISEGLVLAELSQQVCSFVLIQKNQKIKADEKSGQNYVLPWTAARAASLAGCSLIALPLWLCLVL